MSRGVGVWLAAGRTGASSEALAASILGVVHQSPPAYPHDADDFGRCLRLAALVSSDELQGGLDRISAVSGPWSRLAERWSDLVALHAREGDECTDLIRTLTNPYTLRMYRETKGANGKFDLQAWSPR